MSDPLFDTIENTKKRQRLTNLAGGHTVLEQLDIAIDDARGEFYARLGLTDLNTLAAITPADPPTNDDEHKYLIAQVCEQKMVRRSLLSWIPFTAKEGGGGRIYQEWNDVAAFRHLNSEQRDAEIKRLTLEIDRAISILNGAFTPGSVPKTKAASIGSTLDSQYRKVGFSLYAVPPYMFHFSLDSDTITD